MARLTECAGGRRGANRHHAGIHVPNSDGSGSGYHTDALGSVQATTDGSGALIQTYRTDPFGVPTATQGSSGQPFEFTGEPWDAGTGLVYLRGRMYDPQIGRFLQRDTELNDGGIGGQSLLRYACVGNNPVSATDPGGRMSIRYGRGDVWLHHRERQAITSSHWRVDVSPLSVRAPRLVS